MCAHFPLNELVSGSQEFVRFEFIFNKNWDELTTFAQFTQNGVAYNQYLDENNSVYLPPEIQAGTCTLMLYGSRDKVIATTNYLTLTITKDILVSDAQSTEITESLYSQLVSKIDTFMSEAVTHIDQSIEQEMLDYLESGKLAYLAIQDGSITEQKLAKGSVTKEKLSEDVLKLLPDDQSGVVVDRLLNYYIEDGDAIITGYQTNIFPDNYALPNYIEGCPVVGIENNAFLGASIKHVTLPSNLSYIDDYVFENSTLTSVTIPRSLTAIGAGALLSSSLSDIYYEGTEEEWSTISIGSIAFHPDKVTIHYEQRGVTKEYVDNLPSTKYISASAEYVEMQSPGGNAYLTLYDDHVGVSSPNGLDLDGTPITNVMNPKNPSDAANKAYVDNLVGDMETALDELHNYAQALINGGAE
jgi:hypothetical protein